MALGDLLPNPCPPPIATNGELENVLDHGAKGDWTTNATDDTAAFLSAIAAAPDGGGILMPPGHYGLDNLQIIDKSISIWGYGAWAIQLSDAPVIQFDVTYAPVNVVSFTEVTVPLFGDPNNPETVTDVVLAAIPAGLGPGCRVKFVSDDPIPGSVPTSTGGERRSGEFATVLSVNANQVRLAHTLTETLNTNPRMAVVPGHRAGIHGLNVRPDPAGDAAIWNQSLLQINGRSDVTVEKVRLEGGFSFGMEVNGCEGVMINGFVARNLRNDRNNFRFGYGVTLNSSENCSVVNSHFFNCRHGFTTDTQSRPAGDANLSEFGRSKYISVTACTGNNCTNAAFDTHNPTYGITFQSCIATHEMRLPVSTGAGFQIRGKHMKIADCQALNCYRGVIVKDSGIDGATHDVHISNTYVEGAEKFALVIEGSANINTPITDVCIEGGSFRSTGFDEVCRIIQSEVTMTNVKMSGGPLNSPTGSCLIRLIDNSLLNANGCTFDVSGMVGANVRAIHCREQDCRMRVYDSLFIQNAGQTSFRGPGVAAGGPVADQLRAANIRYDTLALPPAAEIRHGTLFNTDLVNVYDPNIGQHVTI